MAAAQLPADIRLDDEGVGLTFAHAKLRDVVLDVLLGVIVVAGIVKLSAARCFQVVDPSQLMRVNEIGVEPEADDFQIPGPQSTAPLRSSRFLRIVAVMCSPPGSWSPHSGERRIGPPLRAS